MAIILVLSLWPLSFAAAQLQCNPCSHGYGQVQVGATKQYSFTLSNGGTATLHILSKTKTGKGFSFGKFPLPLTLKPGAKTAMTFNFTPVSTGKVTGTITLVTDAPKSPLTMNVWGTGVSGQAGTLTPAPTSLAFGNVNVGSNLSLVLKLSASNAPVTISSIQSSGSEFVLSGLSLPVTVAAGATVKLTVTFVPAMAGTASESLTIVSDASNSPTSVPMTGIGVVAGSHRTDLNWNPSADPVIGYNVYRGGTHGGPYKKINPVLDATTNYSDTNVNAGATYYYVVTALDANNNESGYSNEVKAVIPSP